MNALWLAAALIAGVLLYAAASVAESVLSQRVGVSRRVMWIIAMAYLTVLSAAWLVPRGTASSSSTAEWVVRDLLGARSGDRPGGETVITAVHRFDTLTGSGVQLYVLGASLAVSLLLGVALRRHRREASRWEIAELQGETVMLSDSVGPALSGVLHPQIVVPRWVFELNDSAQRAILLHESEHRSVGDSRLQAFGAVLLVLNAWNPMMWLYCRRLLRAIELDCDERVVSRGVAPAEYAGVLLDAYQRTIDWNAWLPSPALAERASGLGRRVENLFRPQARNNTMKKIAGTTLVAALVSLTAFAPSPQSLRASSNDDSVAVEQAKESLKRLVAAQEMHYSDRGTYTTDVAALAALSKKPLRADSVWITVIFAGGRGWTGSAQVGRNNKVRCVVYVGDPAELPKLPKTFGQQSPSGEGAILCDKP